MKKMMYLLLLACFPVLTFAADGSLSFAPPPGDFSMVFLGNIFGHVDGVLHGTGSQIMGSMFGVFNAAVLALGGIIIIYTTMVSTMNTAHQGEFLGKQWSSIWIPVRSTVGLALLMPKASGYCLMQVFVMWVVVQGVGAADKVWETALGYLNKGGVIIKAESSNPLGDLTQKGNPTLNGAYAILAGQVCMLGLEKQLKNTREGYLASKDLPPCNKGLSSDSNDPMNKFCKNSVPDFLASVDFVAAQDGASSPYSMEMPHFQDGSPYGALNGICGTIKWKRYEGLDSSVMDSSKCNLQTIGQGAKPIECGLFNEDERKALDKSRSAALMAMYMELGNVAQSIVGNNPLLRKPQKASARLSVRKEDNYSPIAKNQFGLPYTINGRVCQKYADGCESWGPAPGNFPVIISGVQFVNAIKSYNNVMTPTLNLAKQIKNADDARKSRAFISKAVSQGWLMSGSYFFDLVKLNGAADDSDGLIDKENGLEGSDIFKRSNLTEMFKGKACEGARADLCEWLKGNSRPLAAVSGMIDGEGFTGQVQPPIFTANDMVVVDKGKMSATVNGYAQNAAMIRLPGQPGLAPPTYLQLPTFSIDTKYAELPEVQKFDCGYVFLLGCLGEALGRFFYGLTKLLYNAFIAVFGSLILAVVNAFIMVPLTIMSGVFIQGMQMVSAQGVNPIIALSKMGEHYINAAGNMWFNMLALSVSVSLIPFIGKFIFALMTMAMPIVIAWLGVMLGVGFITCYYVPLMPFLIFTFASIGWLIGVIEAMVAAPIVALGVTHPEGHEAFGKGEHALMILMNVFLRPAMMVIGFISAIALCYVGVWMLNAGFSHAIEYIVGVEVTPDVAAQEGMYSAYAGYAEGAQSLGIGKSYASWAGIYAFFFAILSYTTAYLTIVQKSFTLIHHLPDKVLRWIGGSPESLGAETAGWAEESKKAVESAGKPTADAQGQVSGKMSAAGDKVVSGLTGGVAKSGDSGSMESSRSKPEG